MKHEVVDEVLVGEAPAVVYFVASPEKKRKSPGSDMILHHFYGVPIFMSTPHSPGSRTQRHQMEGIRSMLPPPTKTGPRASKKPAKRPAQPSSQDTSMHPPKKQRLEGAQKDGKGVAKVASAGAGARAAGGKVKRKDGVEKTGEKGGVVAAERLIPTAPGVAVEPTPESSWNPAPKQKEIVTNGAETSNAPPAAPLPTTKSVSSNQTTANAAQSDSKTVTDPTKQTQGAKPTKKNPPKTPAGDTATSHGKQLKTARRMQPMKPLATDGQSALGRPKKASGSGPTRGIDGRDVVFVTRKTSLGSYMRRCKALLVEDGYVR